MVEDNNQPLPKYIPTTAKEQDDNPQSSSEVGNTLALATGALMAAGRTRHASTSA